MPRVVAVMYLSVLVEGEGYMLALAELEYSWVLKSARAYPWEQVPVSVEQVCPSDTEWEAHWSWWERGLGKCIYRSPLP